MDYLFESLDLHDWVWDVVSPNTMDIECEML